MNDNKFTKIIWEQSTKGNCIKFVSIEKIVKINNLQDFVKAIKHCSPKIYYAGRVYKTDIDFLKDAYDKLDTLVGNEYYDFLSKMKEYTVILTPNELCDELFEELENTTSERQLNLFKKQISNILKELKEQAEIEFPEQM